MIGFAGGNAGSTNSARMFIALKPMGGRKLSADQVIARLREKTAHIPGAHALPAGRAGSAHRRPRQATRTINTHCKATDLDDLNQWAPRLLKKMREHADI